MVSGGDSDGDVDDGRVLSPEELDIEDEEEVAPLGDDRYVIGPDGSPDVPNETEAAADEASNVAPQPETTTDSEPDPDDEPESGTRTTPPQSGPRITGRDVNRWLADELRAHDSDYAYHITAKYGSDVSIQQMATDDVGAAFDGLLVWYARQVADDTPVDEALGILLNESSVQIRYPTARLVTFLEQNNLGPDDSISDLVDTVSEQDGLVFPRKR